MNSIRTTLGGAFGAFGTSLMGVGVVPQLLGQPSKLLSYIALVGFICCAIGQFFHALFSADAKQQKENTAAIKELKANTDIISKP